MKSIHLFLLALPVLVWGFSSCNTTDDNVSDIITQGSWRITLYNDSGDDELYHFTGYSFTFQADGSITAVKDGNTVTGTWSTGTDDSHQKIYLDFGSTGPFDELNDDWRVVEQTSVKIRLEDVSGGNGGTDLLTFEKI